MKMEYFRKEGKIYLTFQVGDLELANEIINDAISRYREMGYEVTDFGDEFENAIGQKKDLCIGFNFKNLEFGVDILKVIAEKQKDRGDDPSRVLEFLAEINCPQSASFH